MAGLRVLGDYTTSTTIGSQVMPQLLSKPLLVLLALTTGCSVVYHRVDDPTGLPEATVRPGITVLLRDSIGLIRGKRLALLSNDASVDENGKRDADLLKNDKRATKADAKLVLLFSPEHGLDVSLDRTGVASSTDRQTGLPVISLYGSQTEPPPDSSLRSVDALIVDLQDVGSRTWTYEGAMVYAMRAAARAHKPIIVLDRPNPLTGAFVEGPVLDSALSNADDPAPGRPGLAWAMYSIPLRHGMTLAELALFYN
ncbi:MAG: exo-beta-N-acetylmuramidase NamZ domain-containing protein, partial [Gemmatimonadaceae bacterium]